MTENLRYLEDGRLIQCKDIPDVLFLEAVRVSGRGPMHWAQTWNVRDVLEKCLGPIPPNLLRAKAARLLRKQKIYGCACGCRGDFTLTPPPTTPNR